MSYTPTDWLGPLIEEEIKAAVSWYRQAGSYAHIKKDPGSRFEDDGSNLRSQVLDTALTGNRRVQIVRVLSAEDTSILIGDGFTNVKSWLSSDAAAVLKFEIDGDLDENVKGDVFHIRQCTVVSTPYGPPSGHIHLKIQEIEYSYHLRKIAGSPVPVEDRAEIVRLMGEVMRSRHPEPAQDKSDPPVSGDNTSRRQRQSAQFQTQAAPQSPASQASLHPASSPAAASQAPQTQHATQLPNRNAPRTPQLERDGVQMVAGVNLDMPTAASQRPPARQQANPAHLLSILGQPQPGPIANTAADNQAISPKILGKRKALEERRSDERPPPNFARPAVPNTKWNVWKRTPIPPPGEGAVDTRDQSSQLPATPAAGPVRATKPVSPQQASSGSRRVPRPLLYWQRKIPANQRTLLDSPASWLPPLPGREFPRPNVPIELLKRWNHQARTKPESVTLSQSHVVHQQAAEADGEHSDPDSEEMDTGSSGDDSAQSEDEPIPGWSSSPPQPVSSAKQDKSKKISPGEERRAEVPLAQPSSPLSSSPPEPTPSQTSSRPCTSECRPPDSSFEHPVAPRALKPPQSERQPPKRAQEARSVASTQKTSPLPQRLPTQRDDVTQEGQRSLPPSQPSSQCRKGLFAPRERSETTSSVRQGRIVDSAAKPHSEDVASQAKARAELGSPHRKNLTAASSPSEQTPRRAATQVANTSPDIELLHVRQTPARAPESSKPPPSTSATVIRATQVSKPKDPDVMEIDPPRKSAPLWRKTSTPGIDPALEHRQRRAEHFKKEQRRKWIKANYTPGPDNRVNLRKLCIRYCKAFPKDDVKLSELAEAYEDVYPDAVKANVEADSAPSSSKPSTPSNGKQRAPPSLARDKDYVPSPTSHARASRADLDASDAPTASRASGAVGGKRVLELRSPASRANSSGTGVRVPASPHAGPAAERVSVSTSEAAEATSREGESQQAISGISAVAVPGGGRDAVANATKPRAQQQPPEAPKSTSTPAARSPAPATPTAAASTTVTVSMDPKKVKDVQVHRAWLIKRIERDQRRLREEGGQGEGGASMREFAEAWRRCKPGGAFARRDDEGTGGDGLGRMGEGSTGRRVRLDVLGWEL